MSLRLHRVSTRTFRRSTSSSSRLLLRCGARTRASGRWSACDASYRSGAGQATSRIFHDRPSSSRLTSRTQAPHTRRTARSTPSPRQGRTRTTARLPYSLRRAEHRCTARASRSARFQAALRSLASRSRSSALQERRTTPPTPRSFSPGSRVAERTRQAEVGRRRRRSPPMVVARTRGGSRDSPLTTSRMPTSAFYSSRRGCRPAPR